LDDNKEKRKLDSADFGKRLFSSSDVVVSIHIQNIIKPTRFIAYSETANELLEFAPGLCHENKQENDTRGG